MRMHLVGVRKTLAGVGRLHQPRTMNALTAKAVQDTARHQQASRHEKHWQHAYGSLQSNRQPATKLSTGADAFAEVCHEASHRTLRP